MNESGVEYDNNGNEIRVYRNGKIVSENKEHEKFTNICLIVSLFMFVACLANNNPLAKFTK